MRFKLFYLLLAINLSCSNYKVTSENNRKEALAAKKRAEEAEKLPKERDRNQDEDSKFSDKNQFETEKPLNEHEDSEELNEALKVKNRLHEEIARHSSSNLTSSEIDREIESNKKDSNNFLQEALASRIKNHLSASEIDAKVFKNKQPLDNSSLVSNSPQVNSVIDKATVFSVEKIEENLTLSAIEREKEWAINSGFSEHFEFQDKTSPESNSSYTFKTFDLNPGHRYSDSFRPTVQRTSLTDSDVEKISKSRKFLSDSKIENDETLSDFEKSENQTEND